MRMPLHSQLHVAHYLCLLHMSHRCVSFICHIGACNSYVASVRVIHMSHAGACHSYVTCNTFECDMISVIHTHWNVLHDMQHIPMSTESCHVMNETCHTSRSHVTHEWVTSHMNESRPTWMSHVTHERVTSHMNESHHKWMSHVTPAWVMAHMNESRHTRMSHVTHEWVTSHMN